MKLLISLSTSVTYLDLRAIQRRVGLPLKDEYWPQNEVQDDKLTKFEHYLTEQGFKRIRAPKSASEYDFDFKKDDVTVHFSYRAGKGYQAIKDIEYKGKP